MVCVVLLSAWVSQYIQAAAASRSIARIRRGDKIVSIDGKSARSWLDLTAAASKNKPFAMTLVDAFGNTYSVHFDPRFQRGALSFPASLPIWIAILVTVPTAVLFRFDRRMPPGHCQRCGYNLQGLTEPRCPECGTGFEKPR